MAFNNLRQHALNYGWSHQHYIHYKAIQSNLREQLITESNNNWNRIILETANVYHDPHQFWNKIKVLIGGRDPEPHYIIDDNNTKHFSPENQEKQHRKIWEKVFEEESSDTDDEDEEVTDRHYIYTYLNNNLHRLTPYNNIDISRLNSTLLDKEITTDDTLNIIKHIKNTAPGNSGMNKVILSTLPRKAIQALTKIFNATLSIGYFPDKWKHSMIKLIPKPGKNPRLPINYRPISLLEVPGKIFERIINSRLKHFLESNNRYNQNQFGFRTNRGTNQALALITEKIAQNKSDNGQCQIVLRDITKAFDKVWHIGLKYKILQLNLPITLEKLLCDFLDDRTAQIKIQNYKGTTINLHSGVPQGSVISPTLFTIYTNDIPPTRQGTNIMYADDITQITGYQGKSKKMINSITEKEIKIINKFENKWKIKTNINKFTPLHIGCTKTIPLSIDDKNIEFKKEGISLGLTISNTGYTSHINKRKIKANAALSKIYRLNKLPEKIKIHLVKSLILPIIQYPPIPLHALSNNQIGRLQKTQNKALRFATNQRYPYTMNTEEIHKHTNTKTLNTYLHEQAINIWASLEAMDNNTYLYLVNNKENINKYNRNFPSSLDKINQNIAPRYK